jgi:hypothetical protein
VDQDDGGPASAPIDDSLAAVGTVAAVGVEEKALKTREFDDHQSSITIPSLISGAPVPAMVEPPSEKL